MIKKRKNMTGKEIVENLKKRWKDAIDFSNLFCSNSNMGYASSIRMLVPLCILFISFTLYVVDTIYYFYRIRKAKAIVADAPEPIFYVVSKN